MCVCGLTIQSCQPPTPKPPPNPSPSCISLNAYNYPCTPTNWNESPGLEVHKNKGDFSCNVLETTSNTNLFSQKTFYESSYIDASNNLIPVNPTTTLKNGTKSGGNHDLAWDTPDIATELDLEVPFTGQYDLALKFMEYRNTHPHDKTNQNKVGICQSTPINGEDCFLYEKRRSYSSGTLLNCQTVFVTIDIKSTTNCYKNI